MLRYKNHRFHYGKVSFQIPEGYFIDTAPELISDNFLHLYAPDMSFFIDIHVYTESKDSTAELSSVLRDMKHTLAHPVSIISINGLTGVHAAYRAQGTQYYEAWLDVEKDVTLLILLSAKSHIEKIDTASIVAAIDPRLTVE